MKHKEFISDIHHTKKNDVLLCMPTMDSAQITTQTLKAILENNPSFDFDILVIDNNTEDYQEIINKLPFINYIVLTKNTGSSGAQRIGIEFAVENGYKFAICTDNDAELLTKKGIKLMYEYLKDHHEVGCVAPQHIDYPINTNKTWNRQLPLHYLFMRTNLFNLFEPHNFYHFLMTDDVALTSKIVTNSKLVILKEVTYFHPTFKPSFLANKCFFYYIRGFLIVLFIEKNISFKLRLRHFLHLLFKIGLCVSHAVFLRDSSYLKTIYIAVKNFLSNYKENWVLQVPKNKTELVSIEGNGLNPRDYSKMSIINAIIPKRRYSVGSERNNKSIYYERRVIK